jgi:hypothetical protein
LQAAAAKNGGGPKEVSADLIEAVIDEFRRLDEAGRLRAPHAARALTRRFEQGLVVSALITGRRQQALL